jgi:hypothetical protein
MLGRRDELYFLMWGLLENAPVADEDDVEYGKAETGMGDVMACAVGYDVLCC